MKASIMKQVPVLLILIKSVFSGVTQCPEVIARLDIKLDDLKGTWFESARTFYTPEYSGNCVTFHFINNFKYSENSES